MKLSQKVGVINGRAVMKINEVIGIRKELRKVNEAYSIEEEQLAMVRTNPYQIQYMEKPSERVQMIFIKEKPWAINYIKNPTERVQLIYFDFMFSTIDEPIGNEDNFKKKVIRKLIQYIKEDDWLTASYLLTGARMKGYTWPELDIIEKSVKKELATWKVTHPHHDERDRGVRINWD